ncbi:MAG: hypothetical protein IT322_05485 [Anaerolineae bacterium]|nr:hypothetical protein [Anaerolineae bacterium]
MRPILVQMADTKWTTQAVHLACALARDTHKQVIMLRLNRVEHISYLGSELGDVPLTHLEYTHLQNYQGIAEAYGVEMDWMQIQCYAPMAALIEAAAYLGSAAAFVRVSKAPLRFVYQIRLWFLDRRFGAHGCQLYTLDYPRAVDIERTPSITVHPVKV